MSNVADDDERTTAEGNAPGNRVWYFDYEGQD
jgi:hypothetical protein